MEYISETAFCIEFEHEENMKAFVASTLMSCDAGLLKALNMCEYHYEVACITYHSDYIKWYEGDDGFDDVNNLVRLYKTAHANHNAAYRLLRLGEDMADVEDEMEEAETEWEDTRTQSGVRYAEEVYEIQVNRNIENHVGGTDASLSLEEMRAKHLPAGAHLPTAEENKDAS